MTHSELVKAALAAAEGITAEEAFDTFVEGVTRQQPERAALIPRRIPETPTAMRYREWDMDNDLVTEYERHGECLRCGECCRHRIEVQYSKHDDKYHPGIHGVWNEVSGNGHYFCVQLTSIDPERVIGMGNNPCWALTDDNLCSKHDLLAEHHELCHQWPLAPRCLEHFPGCGYSFTKIREVAISAAYPATWASLEEEWEKEATEEHEKVIVD